MQRPCGFNDGYKRSVAVFRLNLSQRLNVFGFSARKFHLRMSRAETGNYLGMTRETTRARIGNQRRCLSGAGVFSSACHGWCLTGISERADRASGGRPLTLSFHVLMLRQ